MHDCLLMATSSCNTALLSTPCYLYLFNPLFTYDHWVTVTEIQISYCGGWEWIGGSGYLMFIAPPPFRLINEIMTGHFMLSLRLWPNRLKFTIGWFWLQHYYSRNLINFTYTGLSHIYKWHIDEHCTAIIHCKYMNVSTKSPWSPTQQHSWFIAGTPSGMN